VSGLLRSQSREKKRDGINIPPFSDGETSRLSTKNDEGGEGKERLRFFFSTVAKATASSCLLEPRRRSGRATRPQAKEAKVRTALSA